MQLLKGQRFAVMPNSHSSPDKTRRPWLCRVERCELSLETEQLADRSPSSRSVQWRSLGLVICNSPQRVYFLPGVQRRCVWAVGRLGVAAWLWPASQRRSTGRRDDLVVSGVAVRIDCRTSAFCVRVRPAVALRRRTHSLRHRTDTERTRTDMLRSNSKSLGNHD